MPTGVFDQLVNSFGPTRILGVPQILFALVLAFILCSVLAAVYRWTYQGLSYSRSFVHTLILGGIVSCILITAIGNNLARGLGILGTLAIVRFRTHIRDPRDMIFMFCSFAIGIGTGSAMFSVAVVGVIFFCIVAVYLHWSPFASRREFEGLLRFMVRNNAEYSDVISQAIGKCCSSCELIAMREAAQGELLEYSYHIRLHDPAYQAELLKSLTAIDGVTEPSLLMYKSTVEL